MLEIKNPYTNAIIDTIPTASEADVRAAIARADAQFKSFSQSPAHERASILGRTAELIAGNADELARTMVEESGKPIRYARGEVSRAVETFTFAADAARAMHGETVPMDAAKGGVGKVGYYIRVPVGVVAAITPFNFPLNLVAHKIAPAVAAGCTLVLKPNPTTPLSAMRLQSLMIEAGLPEGVFEIVNGDADVGNWLTSDPRVRMITFTGSVGVANAISKVAGIRKTTFELGGNAATIVSENTDPRKSLDRMLVGSFAYSGQVCISVQRIYVHDKHYDMLRDAFVERTKQLKLGDPQDDTTDIGPMINTAACERIQNWLSEAKNDGAVLLTGGVYEGQMFAPTVLEQVDESMQVMCAEVFGPVVNLVPYNDLDDVIDWINASEFGLQAGIYTDNLSEAMSATQKLDVGGVMINDVPTFRVDQMPYGGNKNSGVGREGPRFAVEDMTTLKMVVINP